MRFIHTWIPLACTLLATSCVGVSTDWSYDSAADFDRLETYGWGRIRAAPSKLVSASLVEAVEKSLAEKGFVKNEEDPDFRVGVDFNITVKTGVQSADREFDNVPTSWIIPSSWTGETGQSVAYRTGTMSIDIVDPRTRQLMWRGLAKGRFSGRMEDSERQRVTGEVVTGLLRHFPPR